MTCWPRRSLARVAPAPPGASPSVGAERPGPLGRGAGQAGQASVELVALVPLVVAVVLTLLQVLAAGAAREAASRAAEAGAVAVLQHADPRRAAEAAVPDWSAPRVALRVRGADVIVRVRPRTLVPGLAALLTSTVRARTGGQT